MAPLSTQGNFTLKNNQTVHGGVETHGKIGNITLEGLADFGWALSPYKHNQESLLQRRGALQTSQFNLTARWKSPWDISAVVNVAQPLYVESGELMIELPQYRDRISTDRRIQFSENAIHFNDISRPINVTYTVDHNITKTINWQLGMTIYSDWHTLTTTNSPKIYFSKLSVAL